HQKIINTLCLFDVSKEREVLSRNGCRALALQNSGYNPPCSLFALSQQISCHYARYSERLPFIGDVNDVKLRDRELLDEAV
ncbi:MAG: hypothetical protein FWE59_03940, partial [Oscillospiraceae bacterium]|nr:hypothetical protein [Oscillospiraceae bacterium]